MVIVYICRFAIGVPPDNWYSKGLLPSHAAAFLGAGAAGLCTLLAVVVLVLAAFGGASLTCVSAKPAQLFCTVASQAHQLRRGIAKSCAFHIQLNAFGHHVQVLFLQAGAGAILAGGGATQTGIDTVLVLLIVALHKRNFRGY